MFKKNPGVIMKLCFLAGADSIHSKKWIQYFADKGHEIHWISLTPNYYGDIQNLRLYLVRKILFKPIDLLINILQVRNLIKKIQPDILHAHYAGKNGLIGALSNFHPYVLTPWGSDVLISAKSKKKGFLVRFALGKTDLITCDADHIRNTLMTFGIPLSKIRIVYFGVDTHKFCPGPRNEELSNSLGVSHYKVVISLRSLESIYDIETLIKASQIVLDAIPKTKFLILGRGSQEQYLRQLSHKLGVMENVCFVGMVSNDELPEYLRLADVYVSTSLSDAGIAASTAEAMASGLPVVTTNTGENEKWINDEENGYLIPVKNPQILADKIIHLLKEENSRRIFAKNNRQRIEERNNYHKEMAKMENMYRELIQGRQ
jgi:glycosyltransferase involved in cell wall biosynthesis